MADYRPKICIQTLGCKVNQQESNALADWFGSNGYEIVHGNSYADAYIINTCTVTSMADSKSRQKIRQAKRINPEAVVAAIGCYPQVSDNLLFEQDDIEVDILIGSENKDDVKLTVKYELMKKGLYPAEDINSKSLSDSENNLQMRTRAYVKIEDGCDRFCSYCIIPYARGSVKSRDENEIITEVKGLVANGFKEIVITGINIALYGEDKNTKIDLYTLLATLCEIEGDFRIRLGSMEPNVIDIEIAKKIASLPKMCPHWHLSLQSGSDDILQKMNRNYTSIEYVEMVSALRKIDPMFAITTDIIVGFPGETEKDFLKSVEIVKAVGFSKVHVFKYSRRNGTAADSMNEQIPENIKSERSKILIEVAANSSQEFLAKCSGTKREVLIFGANKTNDFLRGIADNGIEVKIPLTDKNASKKNELMLVTLDEKIEFAVE